MKLTLVKKIDEAKGTKSFFWQPEKKINYLPGQFYYFTLTNLNYNDSRGATRHFTISSSPTEGGYLRFTTRIRDDSGFKKTLDEIKIGETLTGEGPNGTYILDEHEKGLHLLIAGGIGITPFRSFIKYNIDKKLINTKLFLIYSNSLPAEITFSKELEGWSEKYPNFKLAQTITHPDKIKNSYSGLKGRIDTDMIKKIIKEWKINIDNLTFWVCGPPNMVEAMEKTIGGLKITSDKLRTEKFTGY